MVDTHYENPKLAEIYDFDSGWSVDRDFYLSLSGQERKSILDIGCGTGLICNAYAANGHAVTGVDPSAAMLEIARRKPHGEKIEWIQSLAQSYASQKHFDLIIMTGHAFQVLLEDADVRKTFEVMQRHLKPGGSIVFESRNPEVDWAKKWNYEIDLELPGTVVREERRFLKMESGRMIFDLFYRFLDEELVSRSELRFWSRQEIEDHLGASGLSVDKVLGDWDGKEFDSSSSDEMIFVVRSTPP